MCRDARISRSPPAPQRSRSWDEQLAQKRARETAHRLALSKDIQASRENGDQIDRDRARARARHVADILSFRACMVAMFDASVSRPVRSQRPPGVSSFKLTCAVIRQRAQEDPDFLQPEHRKTLGLLYRMVASPGYWIGVANRILEHAKAGIAREITALGPFAGLRVSTRSILVANGINDISELRATIDAGKLALDADITSNGLTRRRWTELQDWLSTQRDVFKTYPSEIDDDSAKPIADAIMRVGRPIKALPHPPCNYCGTPAVLVKIGETVYPYREEHGPLWLCIGCQAWIGIFARSSRNIPLGRLANAELREWKTQLHAALEPMAKAKARRDGCTIFEARAKGFRWLAGLLGIEPKACHIHLLDAAQCRQAIDTIHEFERERRRLATHKAD